MARERQLRSDALAEAGADERHAGAARALAEVEEKLRDATGKCRALEPLPPAERELHAEQIGRLRAMEDLAREVRERRLEQVGRKTPAESSQARMELPLAEQVLAERRELAITAAKLSPPDYIVRELGSARAAPRTQSVGSRRRRDRELPPGARDQGPGQRSGQGAGGRLRARRLDRAALPARGAAADAPAAARALGFA